MAQHTRSTSIGAFLLLMLAATLAVGLILAAISTTAMAQTEAPVSVSAYSAFAPTPTPTRVGPTATAGSSQLSLSETPVPRVPLISDFACEPCVVKPGGGTTLSWSLSGATAAYLDGQGVTAPGSTVVYPDQTTTYRLVAINDEGRSEQTVTVVVQGLPTIHYFTCLPCQVSEGEQSTLSWDLSGATAAYLDNQGVPAPGSTVVVPGQTTTYRLVAVSDAGSVERLVTVTVREGGDPGTVSEALRQSGYDVRWVGHLPFAGDGDTASAIMVASTDDFRAQEISDQYYSGLKELHENFPDRILTVGLYDDVRYIRFVTAEPTTFESFLRGELDGQVFWKAVLWNIWDDWANRWLEIGTLGFADQDFVSKSFGY
jgi:hypothetical protein